MPKELPGFYFDNEKNRYFPVSSKPKRKASSGEDANVQATAAALGPERSLLREDFASTSTAAPARRRNRILQSLHLSRTTRSERQRERCRHDILTGHLRQSSQCNTLPFFPYNNAAISSSQVAAYAGQIKHLLGDSHGFVYSREDVLSTESTLSEHDNFNAFVPEVNLSSRVSSICISGSRYVATSFGPSCKILYHDWDTERAFILQPGDHILHDVWASSFRGRTLAMGMRKRALLTPDIEQSQKFLKFNTQSDVLALHQEEHLLYTGSRNGRIHRCDVREPSLTASACTLFDDVFHQNSNSIVYLNIVNEWQMIVGAVHGDIKLFDLRFPRGQNPTMILNGNQNTHILNLPHTISPCQQYLYAAGSDCRIRGWSLRTGQLLQPPSAIEPAQRLYDSQMGTAVSLNPFATQFQDPVTSLQAIDINHKTYLYVTVENHVLRIPMAQQFTSFDA